MSSLHSSQSALARVSRNLDGFICPVELRAYVNALAVTFAEVPSAYIAYGKEKANAMEARLAGNIGLAMACEASADRRYSRLPPSWIW